MTPDEKALRVRCIEMAIASTLGASDQQIIERAQAFHDFISDSRDGAVLAAARELAVKVLARDGGPIKTAAGHVIG